MQSIKSVMQLLRGCEMPLPDAPDVETSRIYQQFKGLNALGNTSDAVTSDLMDNIRLQQFIDFNSEDELRRLLLVGLASQTMSASGPIANTGLLVRDEQAADGTYELFRPGPGEVYQLSGADFTALGGAVRCRLFLRDVTGTNVELSDITSTSTTNQFPFTDLPGPIFISQNMYLIYALSGVTGGESGRPTVAVIRMR